MTTKHGRVEYKDRAFEQDATAAMRGDIVRALIELITNADDAYGDLPGDVEVIITSREDKAYPIEVSVRDTATGLSPQQMELAFSVLGGTNERFQEGSRGRGHLGRGAKDVAGLGSAVFESVKEGVYTRFTLSRTGEWEYTDQQAAVNDYERLGLPAGGCGLTARVIVDKAHNVPGAADLAFLLGNDAQLRRLCGRRTVTVLDERGKPKIRVAEGRPARGTKVFDAELALADGFDPVYFTLFRLPEAADGQLSSISEQGILVSGAQASYYNTLFGQQGRPESSWFRGELRCPEIEDLVREYDDNLRSERNPMRLITRDRDGLTQQHPYYRALVDAVAPHLLHQLDNLAKEQAGGRHQGEKLNRAFKAAQMALGNQVRRILEEIDEEPPGPGGSDQLPSLSVVPPQLNLRPGEERTLQVRQAETPAEIPSAVVSPYSTQNVIEVMGTGTTLKQHPRLPCVTSTLRIRALASEGSADVEVRAGEHRASLTVTVVDPGVDVEVEADHLQFERASYSASPGKGRNLMLLAPADHAGREVSLSRSAGDGHLSHVQVQLKPSPQGRRSQAAVHFTAPPQPGSSTITALLDEQEANCRVITHEPRAGTGLNIEIELVDQKSRQRRVVVMEKGATLEVKVYGGHSGLKGVLGGYDSNAGKFKNEDSPAARAVLAEVIGLELASYLVELEALRRPEANWDASRVIQRQREFSGRLIPIAQKALEDQR